MNNIYLTGTVINHGKNPMNEKITGMIIDDQLREAAFQANFIGHDAEVINSSIVPGDTVSVSGNVAGIQLNTKGNLIVLFNAKLLEAKRNAHITKNLLEDDNSSQE